MTRLSVDYAQQLAVLQDILTAATQEASVAMCRWTDGQITLKLDEVRELPLEEVSAEIDMGSELLTMVVLTLPGDVGGTMILSFDELNGRRLAASILKQPVSDDSQWSELEKSALNETGNILGCAYFNAISRLLDVEFVPSTPTFLQDFGVCVLQQALMEQLADTSNVVICRTTFTRGGEELNWNVLFVPNANMREVMKNSI